MDFAWGTEVVNIDASDLPALKAKFVISQLPQEGRVVDVGCGGGKLLKTISLHRPELTLGGCDIRPGTAEVWNFDFRLIDPVVGLLPYTNAYADAVLLVDVLEHAQQPSLLLSEVRRILKPAGILIAYIPAEGQRFSAYRVFRKFLGEDLYARTKDHIHAFSLSQLDALLSSDFIISKKRYAYHLLGHILDATFFAATTLPALQRKFWERMNTMSVEIGALPSVPPSSIGPFDWRIGSPGWSQALWPKFRLAPTDCS